MKIKYIRAIIPVILLSLTMLLFSCKGTPETVVDIDGYREKTVELCESDLDGPGYVVLTFDGDHNLCTVRIELPAFAQNGTIHGAADSEFNITNGKVYTYPLYLTIITPSLHATMELLNSDAKIFLIGGEVNNWDANIAKPHPDNAWDNICPNKAIIGGGGISVKYGVTDFSLGESLYLGRIINRASNIILAVDNSKFGQVHGCITCPMQNVTRIVTGNRKQEEILQDFSAYRHRFVFVDGYV